MDPIYIIFFLDTAGAIVLFILVLARLLKKKPKPDPLAGMPRSLNGRRFT